MKHAILFGIVAVLAIGAFGGCRSVSGNGTSSCGCLEANCCGWEFYKPCDLIEGRIAHECPDCCGAPAGPQGVVYERYCGPAVVAPSAAPAQEPVEEIEEVMEMAPDGAR